MTSSTTTKLARPLGSANQFAPSVFANSLIFYKEKKLRVSHSASNDINETYGFHRSPFLFRVVVAGMQLEDARNNVELPFQGANTPAPVGLASFRSDHPGKKRLQDSPTGNLFEIHEFYGYGYLFLSRYSQQIPRSV